MIFRAYGRFASGLIIAGLLLIAGLWSFGKPQYFDYLFLITLFFAAALSYRDINIFGVVVMLATIRIVEELLWQTVEFESVAKPALYCLSIVILWVCKNDRLSWLGISIATVCILAELHWLANGYQAPGLHWYVAMICLNFLLRSLLMYRPQITRRYLARSAEPAACDAKIRCVAAAGIWVQAAVLVEYMLRYFGQMPDLLYVYDAMPYAMHLLALTTLWLIANTSAQRIVKRRFKA